MYYVIVLHDYLLLHDLTVFRINQDEFFEPISIILLFILLSPFSSDIFLLLHD